MTPAAKMPKKVSETLTPKSIQVSNLLTKRNKTVSKTLTFKFVKYVPINGGESVVIRDTSSVKTLLKTLKIKDIKEYYNNNKDERFWEKVIHFYRDNLQRGIIESPFNYELLTQWYDEYGYDLLLAVMKVAAKADTKGVKYIESVLLNWEHTGIKTLDDTRLDRKR
ncbi:DnaD domain protein [Gracilibacillus sp. YIM 98692]|uniref:DnaD domain-containing protein n=1 Tax=Gracilibacillus sp. YIM 98692 TaxID=2663532 RepID=UPI0013D633D5|nr:DnaD domain protein [Gracilibacillus sp. YIM 98692]